MNISELIKELIEAGYSEARIAKEVDYKTNQSTINRIKNGGRSARFELGMAIVDLHKSVVSNKAIVA